MWNKENGDLRARPHSARLPIYEKELKKSIGPGVVLYAFTPGQPSLGTEEDHWKQKPGEDVIELGSMFQTQQAAEISVFWNVVLAL